MQVFSSLCLRFSKKQYTECLKLLHDLEFFMLAFRPFQIQPNSRSTDMKDSFDHCHVS